MLEIASTLTHAGFETWCVGGAVRDALLGNVHLDWDLATSARPPEVQRLFKRTIPVGIKFGTVGVVDRTGRMHEVTTFRRDFNADGRHSEVEFGVSLHDDLARRDFTINAMAWDPIGHRFEDPFGGRADLESRLIRAVGDPDARFHEDRLRALRAIRFASRFGFEIDPGTWGAIQRSAPHFGRLSAERVKQELDKTMEQVRRPSEALARWQSSGAFATLIPALAELPERYRLACDAMAMPGLSTRPFRRTLRFAALFAGLHAKTLRETLKALKFSNMETAAIISLAGNWNELGEVISARLLVGRAGHGAGTGPADPASAEGANAARRSAVGQTDAWHFPDRELRRWVAAIGRTRVAAFGRVATAIWWADRTLGQPAPTAVQARQLYRRLLTIAFRDPIEIGDLALDGDDLRRLGVSPGPMIGRVLQRLLTLVLDDPAGNSVDSLTAEVRRLVVQSETES